MYKILERPTLTGGSHKVKPLPLSEVAPLMNLGLMQTRPGKFDNNMLQTTLLMKKHSRKTSMEECVRN